MHTCSKMDSGVIWDNGCLVSTPQDLRPQDVALITGWCTYRAQCHRLQKNVLRKTTAKFLAVGTSIVPGGGFFCQIRRLAREQLPLIFGVESNHLLSHVTPVKWGEGLRGCQNQGGQNPTSSSTPSCGPTTTTVFRPLYVSNSSNFQFE